MPNCGVVLSEGRLYIVGKKKKNVFGSPHFLTMKKGEVYLWFVNMCIIFRDKSKRNSEEALFNWPVIWPPFVSGRK